MTEKHTLSDLTIITCLDIHYGVKVATLTLLPIGADITASIYKARALDQNPLFHKS